MMNIAAAPGGPLPSHFAPPARSPSTRRPLYPHPTLHMRPETSPRHSAQEFVSYPQPLPAQYSPPSISHPAGIESDPSGRVSTPQNQQYPAHAHIQQQRQPLQRQPTAGSSNSLAQYVQPGPSPLLGHRRQTASTSTSNSSIIRIPSGHSQYPPSTPPILQTRPANIPAADTYVARLRRAKATVWSARGQREDLDRSNSKEDKYNKKYAKRPAPKASCTKLMAGGPYNNSYEAGQYLPAHPRQLQPRLSANEVEDEDEIDPFISGPNFFDTTTTALSTKESIKTKTTTSSTSPSASALNMLAITPGEIQTQTRPDSKSSMSIEDNRSGSPIPLQKYHQPVGRRESRRVSRAADDDGVTERQVGGERRLFVVNASPSESEDEA